MKYEQRFLPYKFDTITLLIIFIYKFYVSLHYIEFIKQVENLYIMLDQVNVNHISDKATHIIYLQRNTFTFPRHTISDLY